MSRAMIDHARELGRSGPTPARSMHRAATTAVEVDVLLNEGIDPEVVSAVESVTKRDGEPYDGNITCAPSSPTSSSWSSRVPRPAEPDPMTTATTARTADLSPRATLLLLIATVLVVVVDPQSLGSVVLCALAATGVATALVRHQTYVLVALVAVPTAIAVVIERLSRTRD